MPPAAASSPTNGDHSSAMSSKLPPPLTPAQTEAILTRIRALHTLDLPNDSSLGADSALHSQALQHTLSLLAQGTVMTGYAQDRRGGSTLVKKTLLVFYKQETDSIHWCSAKNATNGSAAAASSGETNGNGTAATPTNGKSESPFTSISISDITDLLTTGKSSPLLSNPNNSAAVVGNLDTTCFAIVTPHLTIDLDTYVSDAVSTSVQQAKLLRDTWVFGVQAILAASGRNGGAAAAAAATDASFDSQVRPDRKSSILPFTAPAGLPATSQQTMIELKSGSLSSASNEKKTTDAVALMTAGRRFTRYYLLPGKTDLQSQQCTVFYSKSQNSLYWCEPGQRNQDENSCMKLSSIRKVLLGKQSAILKNPSLASIPNTTCVCLTDSKKDELNLSGESPEVMSVFLFGLQHLVQTKSGKNVKVETPAEHQERLSRPKDAPVAPPPPPPAPPAGPLSPRSAAGQAASLNAMMKSMSDGAEFYLYSVGTDKKVTRTNVHAWYSDDLTTSAGTHRSSVWTPSSQQSITGSRTAQETIVDLNVKRRPSLVNQLNNKESIRMLEDGRRFTRYYETTDMKLKAQGQLISKELITVFYVRSHNAFYWSKPGTREQKMDQVLSLNILSDVYLGKQTPIFQSTYCGNIDASRCLSLIDSNVTLNLESDTTEALASFLFGLQALLTSGGRDVLVESQQQQGSQQQPHSDSLSPTLGGNDTPHNPPRRFSVITPNPTPDELSTSRYQGFKRALLSVPESEHFRVMSEGRDFYIWSYDKELKKVRKQIQTLFYVPSRSQTSEDGTARPQSEEFKLGCFYYCDHGAAHDENTKKRLLLAQLSDVYVGKQSKIFLDPVAASANIKCCITLVCINGQELNIESLDQKTCSTYLAGINSILANNGMTVLLEDINNDARASNKSSRFSIVAPKPLPGVDMSNPKAIAHALAEGTRTTDGTISPKTNEKDKPKVPLEEVLTTLTEGRRFTRYFFKDGTTDKPAKEQITLFYVKDLHTLFWSAPGTRQRVEANSIKLSTISDMFLGKRTPVFQSDFAKGTSNSVCMSLKSRTGMCLDIEADTVEHLSSWLYCIQAILSKSGKKLYVNEHSKDASNASSPGGSAPPTPSSKAGGSSSSSSAQQPEKRLSVLGSSLDGVGGVSGSRHESFKRDLLSIPQDQNMQFLTTGCEYFVYSYDAQGKPKKTRTMIFYVQEDHSFYSSLPGTKNCDPSHSLRVKSLTDVYVGKLAAVLKTPLAANVEKQRCITLKTKAAEWNLEGDTKESITSLLAGINYLLNSNGMQVLIDEKVAGGAGGAPPKSTSPPPTAGAPSRPAPTSSSSASASSTSTATAATLTALPPSSTSDRRYSIVPPPDESVLATIAAAQQANNANAGVIEDEEDEGPLGSVYYCLATVKPRQPIHRILLRDLTDIYNLHQSVFWKSRTAQEMSSGMLAESVVSRCLSLVTLEGETNFEARSEGTTETWLEGLRVLLMSGGSTVVEEQKPAGGNGSQGNSANGSTVNSPTALSPNPSKPASRRNSGDAASATTHLVQPITSFDTLNSLNAGESFTSYRVDETTKKIVKSNIWMWYRESIDHLTPGTLCWLDRNSSSSSSSAAPPKVHDIHPDSDHCMSIGSGDDTSITCLQEIAQGKSGDLFTRTDSVAIQTADASKCFTLTGANGKGVTRALNLESTSSASQQKWVKHLNTLLTLAKQQALEVNGGTATKHSRHPSPHTILPPVKEV